MKELKQVKNEKGITLIVLIITVIVMLILAGIVINDAIGEGGLIGRAEDATNRHRAAENHELNVLNRVDSKYDQIANRIDGGGNGGNTIYTKNKTINGGEPSAFNPEIPKGFKPVDIDDAKWGDGTMPPSEDAVKKGLVIEDEEGNQFVWIAVDGETVKLNRYTFAEDGTETACGDEDISQSYEFYQELTSSEYGNTVAKDINAFKTSVEEHGGYYFARYEASYGIDGKPNSKVSTNFNEEEVAMTEGQLWNYIIQPDAANACQNMYDKSYGITSDLVNSYAWDTAIIFIQKYSKDDYSAQTSLNTSNLANTGENGDEKCHIQDMASNCYEWTTETSGLHNQGTDQYNHPCVIRGGDCFSEVCCTDYRGKLRFRDELDEQNHKFSSNLVFINLAIFSKI